MRVQDVAAIGLKLLDSMVGENDERGVAEWDDRLDAPGHHAERLELLVPIERRATRLLITARTER